MVKLPNIFHRKKDDGLDDEHLRNMALSEQQTPLPEEQLYSLGANYYNIIDPEVLEILKDKDKKYLEPFIIACSHLNRLTRIGKTEASLAELDYEFLIQITKLNMPEDTYENEAWGILEALKLFTRSIINDAFNGHKARMISELRRVVRAELSKGEK